MRFLLLLLVAAIGIGITIVLLAIRSGLRVDAEPPPRRSTTSAGG